MTADEWHAVFILEFGYDNVFSSYEPQYTTAQMTAKKSSTLPFIASVTAASGHEVASKVLKKIWGISYTMHKDGTIMFGSRPSIHQLGQLK